jgi:hypothetical protein
MPHGLTHDDARRYLRAGRAQHLISKQTTKYFIPLTGSSLRAELQTVDARSAEANLMTEGHDVMTMSEIDQ